MSAGSPIAAGAVALPARSTVHFTQLQLPLSRDSGQDLGFPVATGNRLEGPYCPARGWAAGLDTHPGPSQGWPILPQHQALVPSPGEKEKSSPGVGWGGGEAGLVRPSMCPAWEGLEVRGSLGGGAASRAEEGTSSSAR